MTRALVLQDDLSERGALSRLQMEVTIAKRDLLRVVGRCQGVADKRSTMPVLSNVLLSVEGPSDLSVAATDLYVGVRSSAPVEVAKGGSVAVPARDLFERVKMMPEGMLGIATTDAGQTVLRATGAARRYTLHGMPGSDFPQLPQPEKKAQKLELEAETLATLIGRTAFSISSDETRAALNSALFEWDGDHVRMVTTDGHRLSKMEAKAPGRHATASMLIPLKAVGELRRLAEELIGEGKAKDGEAAKVAIVQSGPNAFFQFGGTLFFVKLVDAQFPPYAQVIPQSTDRRVSVPRALFADALRAVSLAASDRTGGVRMALSKGKMRITSESPESGDGMDEIPVDYDGGDLTIGFNARYFLDVLGALADEEVVLGVGGDLDPAVIEPATSQADRAYKAVVMPMRI